MITLRRSDLLHQANVDPYALLVSAGYTPISPLGRGSYGEVWLAKDGHGRDAAIKVLIDHSQDARLRFRREAEILARVYDPNIVSVQLLDVVGPYPLYVMEHCEYGSLRSWVQRRRPEGDVVVALIHAASGLRTIHEHGGFHRDVKPDNLLLARGAGGLVVKLGDFGLARIRGAGGTPSTASAAGTDGYVAPEVIAGSSFTAAADIFSLGITGVELLSGSRDVAALRRVRPARGLVDLLTRMCAVDRTRRPDAASVVQHLRRLAASGQGSEPGSLIPWLLGAVILGAAIVGGGDDD